MDLEAKRARIQELRPIDDVFFEVLASDPSVCEEILRTILRDPKLVVLKVFPQNSVRNLRGRSVRLDALCQLGNGKTCNVEVQRADDDDHLRRARYNASCLTANITDPGTRFRDVPDIIVVYISQNDFLKQGKTVYHIEKVIRETGGVIDDGLTEIFVNAKINDGSAIAELMQCFLEQEPSSSKFPAIRNKVNSIKHTEGGIAVMCEVMDKYAKEYSEEIGIKSFILACKMCMKSIAETVKMVAAQFEISDDEAEQKVSMYW